MEQGQGQPEQRRELLDASPQRQDLLPEFRRREVRHFQTDHDPRRRVEPPTRRRARDSEIRRDGQVPGSLNEVSEPMVITSLRDVVVMRTIIGGSLTDLNSSRPMGMSVGVLTTRSRKCTLCG